MENRLQNPGTVKEGPQHFKQNHKVQNNTHTHIKKKTRNKQKNTHKNRKKTHLLCGGVGD